MSKYRRPGRKAWLAVFVALTLLVAAGCSSSKGNTSATVQSDLSTLSSKSGTDRQNYLVQQAEKEGKVVMYSNIAPATDAAWQKAFNAAYPKVQAQIVRLADADLVQRATSEANAGKPVASLVVLSSGTYAPMKSLLAKYSSPQATALPSDLSDPSGLTTVLELEPMVNIYNTQKIQKSQVPTTLQGLTDPALKGKLGTTSVDGPLWLGAAENVMGQSAADALAKQVSQQDVTQFSSNTDLINAVTSGQVPMAFCVIGASTFQAQANGAPIDYVATEPQFATSLTLSITNDAPDPYAAALLFDWLMSKDGGQKVDLQVGATGPRTDVDYVGTPIIKNAQTLVLFSPTVEADISRLTSTWQSDFGKQ